MRHDPKIIAGLLAAAATLVVMLPMRGLFDASPWLYPSVLGVVVVAASGMILRSLTHRSGVIIIGQALVAAAYVLVTQLGETTRLVVLPTPRSVTALVDHFEQARDTITTYAAPAPATPGIVVALVIIVVVVALAVDLSSVTAGTPAVAGLPLLSLFLVSAANSGGSLYGLWFVVSAALWLAMVAHQSDIDLRGWATSIPLMARGDGDGIASRSHRWQAARVGAFALVAAVAVATFVPHLPPRYVLDGLGRGGGGAGGGAGLRLSSELDLRRSLESPSEVPVLRYTTDDPTPGPLRVAVVEDFDGGLGRMRSRALEPQEGYSPENPVARVPDTIGRDLRTLVVEDNGIAAPQLPLPWLTRSADLGGIPWSLGVDGTAQVQRTPGTYSASFVELDPQDADFAVLPPSNPDTNVDNTAYRDAYLSLDSGSIVEVSRLANSLAGIDATPIEIAQAIQEYLRGPDFEYDLELPERPQGRDPVVHFLRTKVGYCQQFAATMTLLARARGIPARVVIGFLPGSSANGRDRIVRASDAHAWPELYFEGVGWTRFEPTPGQRAASVPGYSISIDDSTSTDTTTSTSEPTSTSSTAPSQTDETVVADPAAAAQAGTPRWVWWLLGLAGLLAVLAILPATAWFARRRERRTARDSAERVEREWRELVTQLEDLGIRAPVGATPRQSGRWIGHRMHLEAPMQEQLDHVVATLERARYGTPGQDLPDVSREVDALVGRVRSSRQRSAQLRSILWPQDGLDVWRSWGRAVLDRLPGRR
ncbi:hypothetical protein ASG73_05200 [Janibacter sp. Soil728]|uniref:transglutaminase family protein n=1 Tax=Janibacter sp. Soil728 TaxID=1736393 RepID=UPI00070073B9|nr:DUF3488 and transglutaminase-like domain-containing protein [Janibacter sp. Soil728]KRE38349.1 hypothetical protein ASG73_05200 [Janibacter sp. Soil728]